MIGKQFKIGDGPDMATRPKGSRPTTIEAGVHHHGSKGRCSACEGPAQTGVRAHTTRVDTPFDPKTHAHVFICIVCAERFGQEAVKARAMTEQLP